MESLTITEVNNLTTLLPSTFSEKLTLAKQRVDLLEAYRTRKALHNSSPEFQQVFFLLPVLLHYNHPALIGYVPDAPQGIYHFTPNTRQQAYLEAYSLPFWEDMAHSADFDGLYIMGSMGSVTQTTLSDFDFWLCYTQKFSSEQRQKIQQKLQLLKIWAKGKGIEVNFYLMNPTEFSARQYDSDITPEHCGSAQHYFLLDEFYRSAIRLAGKRILWLHIDDSRQRYNEIIEKAQAEQQLDLSQWLDFGDFPTFFPLGEYFGASLWQLYKGIENPHKSAIKILLLESYTENYPNIPLISVKFKRLLLSLEKVNYHFDPYLAMLEQVTRYLENCKEFTQLDRLRCCFYVKAMEGQQDPWRIEQLHRLAKIWGWSEKYRQQLENRREWKIKQAIAHQQMLIDQQLKSYRHLIHFARKFHISPSIMPQDTDLLMRKLYSAFEVLPGKVVLINPQITNQLEEAGVTFVEVTDNGSNKAGWYMVNHAPLSMYDPEKRHIQYQKSLNKLVAWAYFNGIVTVNTQVHLISQTVELAKLRQFISDLRLTFPIESPFVSNEDLHHPNEIRHLIVAVNLTQDPTQNLPNLSEIAAVDLFNLSASSQGIIGSVSIIYRNMWNEIITQHIEETDAILKALKLISNKIYRNTAPPESVNVFCYSAQLTQEIKRFVLGLVNRCITVQTGVISQKQSDTFNLMGKKWQLIFGKQVELKELVAEEIASPSAPKEIYNFASEGFLQFFFEDNPNGSFNVYVLDKKNQLEVYAQCSGAKQEKIKQISQLYANGAHLEQETFNYPQFYQLLPDDNGIIITPFQSQQHRAYLAKGIAALSENNHLFSAS